MGIDAILGGMLAFLLTAAGIRLFIPFAHHYRLVDRAGDRKRHVGDIPLIGGLAMYAGLGITALWLHRYSPVDYASGVAYAGMGIMALIGFVDDMHGLPVRIRLIAQLLAGLAVTLIAGCVLTDFGRLLSSEVLALGFLSIPLTVIAFTGGVNSLNMSDGVDGLAGGLALITLVSLLVIALVTTSPVNTHLAFMVALIGTVSGFLLFNYRWRQDAYAQVFMGDAGSMSLGFIITWLLIDLSQGPHRAMTPVTALWIFAIPLMDTMRLMIFRMMNGHSPFKPGRDHLHYYFLDAGLSVQMTVKILLWSQVILSSIGIIGLFTGISEKFMFLAALSMFILFFIVLLDSEKAVLQLRRWLTV